MDAKAFMLSAGVAAIFIVANLLTKKSLEDGYHWLTPVVALLGAFAFIAFRYVCKRAGLAVASGVVDSILTIGTIVLALLIFREPLTARQWLGLAVLILGLYLVR